MKTSYEDLHIKLNEFKNIIDLLTHIDDDRKTEAKRHIDAIIHHTRSQKTNDELYDLVFNENEYSTYTIDEKVECLNIDLEPDYDYRQFNTPEDLGQFVDEKIREFPIVNGERKITEFGFDLIGNEKAINMAVLPKVMMIIPKEFLEKDAAVGLPQVFIGTDGSNIFWKFTIDRTKNGVLTRQEVVLPFNKVYLNGNFWNVFSKKDKVEYARYGFGPNIESNHLVKSILQHPKAVKSISLVKDITPSGEETRVVKGLTFLQAILMQNGTLGDRNQWFESPIGIAYRNRMNRYLVGKRYHKGNIHPHFAEDAYTGIGLELAKLRGEREYLTDLSAHDFNLIKGNQYLNRTFDDIRNQLLTLTGTKIKNVDLNKPYINTQKSFIGIAGMESFINNGIKDWKVTDWGFVDFNNFTAQEFRNLVSINDEIMDMMEGKIKIDVGVIKEHHRIIGDKKKKNFGPGTTSPHIGGKFDISV